MKTTYRTECWGEVYEVSADWAQASDSVWGCPGKQVADFQHYPERAMAHALRQEAMAGGFDLDDLTDPENQQAFDEIAAAVDAMVECENEEPTP